VLAAVGLLIFQSLTVTSGLIYAGDGLGWDGQGYARVMTHGLDAGSVTTRSRPLLPVVTRLPHALGLDVIASFRVMNVVYAFTLYLFVSLLLERYGASMRVRAVVVANLALCIATSKMFAYYPVLIDLGALALMMAALYFILTDRHALAGAVCVLAVASREFAVALPLCGLHRVYRRGQLWPDAVWYFLGFGAAGLVRYFTYDKGSLGLSDALNNLAYWRSPLYITTFLYFAVTVFGGISVILALHARWCVSKLHEEPELATFLVLIAGLSAVGSLDLWRYMMFALPAVVVLIARYFSEHIKTPALERLIAAAITFATVMTQRPFQPMDGALYFRDWFPFYLLRETPPPADLLLLWGMRLLALILVMAVMVSIPRSQPRLQGSPS
jgi:hypothetical protein